MIPGKMNCMDLLRKQKEKPETKDIPIIVLTNLDTQKQEAIKLGTSDYLLKANITPDDIVTNIRKYI